MTRHTRPTPATTRGTEPARAACYGTDDYLWFVEPRYEPAAAKVAADRYCNDCPIRRACLEQAVTHAVEGIWAGTTWAQRQTMRRRAGTKGTSLANGVMK